MPDRDINKLYNLWLENATEDKDLIAELKAIKDNQKEIKERFWKDLEFGTGGLRGVIAAGSNRMNIYTVRKATQGLADYICSANRNGAKVAIAYDSRIKSDLFAVEAARVLAANGIKVYIFPELTPTPMLSFAVRYLGCDAGIVITASHNPSKYNGYKVYGSDGCQITLEVANSVIEKIHSVDCFTVKLSDFEEGLDNGLINYINDEVTEEYYENVLKCQINPGACNDSDLRIVYTPLNGAGNKPVREILKKIGIRNLSVVKAQENPDGNFTTCNYPNPEVEQAYQLAKELADEVSADLIIATDPDCDRVGVAVKNNNEYTLLSGNEIGVLMLEYILKHSQEKNTLPKNPVIVKTIVTTQLAEKIAEKYNTEVINVLTGFKFIGEQIGFLEQKGEQDRYVFGFEESYGYLSGSYVRDKDAVFASMLISEMTAVYKKRGETLLDNINRIYAEYGEYKNTLLNYEFEGISGMQKMKELMQNLRAKTPDSFAGYAVTAVYDYMLGEAREIKTGCKKKLTLPQSDVIGYKLEKNNEVIIRPSGTEPKIKVYITASTNNKSAREITDQITKEVNSLFR